MVTKNANRMQVWSGASPFNGEGVLVLATGLAQKSANTKTGDMVQLHILVADVNPTEALKTGRDAAVCGNCPHRSVAAGGTAACYTHGNIARGWAQTSTYNAHQKNGSASFDLEAFRGLKVRFGAYGDPAVLPFEVVESIAQVADNFTGYTHQWSTCDQRLQRYCMASVDTIDEARAAAKAGWRLFFARPLGMAKPAGMVTCPAAEEAGKRTECATCLQCSGISKGRRANITIAAHGSGKKRLRSLPLAVA